jgi:hypothetical protein
MVNVTYDACTSFPSLRLHRIPSLAHIGAYSWLPRLHRSFRDLNRLPEWRHRMDAGLYRTRLDHDSWSRLFLLWPFAS